VNEVSKSQLVRALDVLAVGPLMVAGGSALRRTSPTLGLTLVALGVATVIYNGHNFLETRELQREALEE
jgi:hypothetical protein